MSPYRTPAPPAEDSGLLNIIGGTSRYFPSKLSPNAKAVGAIAGEFIEEFKRKYPSCHVVFRTHETADGRVIDAVISGPFEERVRIISDDDFMRLREPDQIVDLAWFRMQALIPLWYRFPFRIGKTLRPRKK